MSDEEGIVHRDEYIKPHSLFPEFEELARHSEKIYNDKIDELCRAMMKAAKTNPYKNHWDAWRPLDDEHQFHQPELPWDNSEHDVLADIQTAKEKIRSDHYKSLSDYFRRLEGHEQRMKERKLSDSVAIVSGGLDSITLVYDMLSKDYTPHLLSFDYGQRHKKELAFAKLTAMNLGLKHDIVDLTGITHLISNSALTTPKWSNTKGIMPEFEIEVPDGHYAEETMKATVVPNRNMIMLSIAAGVAVNNSYRGVFTGVHAGDHFIYPDCRPNFIRSANAAIVLGNQGFGPIPEQHEGSFLDTYLIAPFINESKANIAYRALELGVPLHLTWSCYKGGENHCGRCGTCVERLEAINEAQTSLLVEGTADPKYVDQTVYDDNEFWKTAIKEAKK